MTITVKYFKMVYIAIRYLRHHTKLQINRRVVYQWIATIPLLVGCLTNPVLLYVFNFHI